jgi:mannose-6-phosphate isomerase-like protein (cupin superfamily)
MMRAPGQGAHAGATTTMREATMGSEMSGPKIEAKSHDTPDEVRTPDKTRVEIVRLTGHSIARLTMEPGWRWSECVKPVVGGDSCQVHHVGYAVEGRIVVRMADGTEQVIQAGDSYTIPPGHDAWVNGDSRFVGIEVQNAEQYAKAGA